MATINTGVTLFCHDIRESLPKDILPNTIDKIITDPPYGKDFLEVYPKLAELAAIVLKPGGSLFAMVGTYHLPFVLQALGTTLNYHWICRFSPPDYATIVWDRHLQTTWKPVVWFVKGTYDPKSPSVSDNITRKMGKITKYHQWSQSVITFKEIITQYTRPTDIIYDPFMGGGAVAVAATHLGRTVIGSDIDPQAIRQTQKHLKQTTQFARFFSPLFSHPISPNLSTSSIP